MLKYSIRKSTSNSHWEPFILRDIYLSPDMSYISGITDSPEPITSDSKILVKKKDDSSYGEYFVANVRSAIVRGKVTYYRELPEMEISRVVDCFDENTNQYGKKTISGTYVAYNDAVYYKYQYDDTPPSYGYFINDRFYKPDEEKHRVVIDEIVNIESDKVVIDGHEFQVFSSGSSTDEWFLRYNEESGPLSAINGSAYTVELSSGPSSHKKIQKVVLYKSETDPVNIEDIQAGSYQYYVDIEGRAYSIKYYQDYDRYGIIYEDNFYPVIQYCDDNPYIPSGNTSAGDTSISGVSRCMPPFDNHIVRIPQEGDGVWSGMTVTTGITFTEDENGNYFFSYEDNDYQAYEPVVKDIYEDDGVDYGTVLVYNADVKPFTDYPVTQNLVTNSSGDFLILMTSDENMYEVGDKIIAKSNGAIESTLYLENDEHEGEDRYYIMFNGKRYDAIEHGYDTIELNGNEYRLIYDNDGYTKAHCEISGETVNFTIERYGEENILVAKRDDPTYLKVGKRVEYNDYVEIGGENYPIYTNGVGGPSVRGSYVVLSGTTAYVLRSTQFYVPGPLYRYYTLFYDTEVGKYGFSFDGDSKNYYLNRFENDRRSVYAKNSEGNSILGWLDNSVGTSNVINYDSTITDYIAQSSDGLKTYMSKNYGNDVEWDGGYEVTEGYAIKIGVNYYKVYETTRLSQSGDTFSDENFVESLIYTVTITEPEEYIFRVDEVLGSGTLLLYSYSSNLMYENFTDSEPFSPNVVGAEETDLNETRLTPPYYSYGVARVAEAWENFTFYLLDDVFGEEPVTPESGLIILQESRDPVSSWDVNRIKTNLDMYHSVSYLNLSFPITSCKRPDILSEDLRSNVFIDEYAKAHINKIVDMEKIPFKLADREGKLINRLSIDVGNYDLNMTLNENGIVPQNVKNSFVRMSVYDSVNSQYQELIGTMCLFFGGASIPMMDSNDNMVGVCGADGLIYENLNGNYVYSVYDPSIRKNSSNEGLTLYAFKYNYDVAGEMNAYIKLEFFSAKSGKVTPLCPWTRPNVEIPLSKLTDSYYFTCKLKYSKENGYLFTPLETASNLPYQCWQTNTFDDIYGGTFKCNRPKIKDESGLEPVININ